MATKYFCDRCQVEQKLVNLTVIKALKVGLDSTRKLNDLCSDCVIAFIEWSKPRCQKQQ